jgi:uncharacterized protein YjiS (DUF1127 family)
MRRLKRGGYVQHQPAGTPLTTDYGSSSGGLIMSTIPWLTSGKGAAAPSHHADAETCRPSWKTQFLRWWAKCSARSRERQALVQLDDEGLKDIGVTREQAKAEARKPFWK